MDITQLKTQYKAGERNFHGVQLSGVSLAWVELKGVNFRGADLSHANLSGADLSESNLSGGTNLTFADLSRADLRNTNLKGTRLEGANLESIQLEGAVYDENTSFPLGFDPLKAGAIASGALQPAAVALETPQPTKPDVDLEEHASRERPKLREKETKPKNTPPRIFGPKPTVDTAKKLFQKARSATVDTISDWQKTAKATRWVSAASSETSRPETDVSNTSGRGKSGVVPASIKGSWNWGALLLPWFWFLDHRVWGGFLLWPLGFLPGVGSWITFGFAVVMAANGNTWAWQNRRWESVEAFKKHQRVWTIAGIVFWIVFYIFNLASRR
ncbi:pentapeptide repeat-containing protein [Altericista sp. CCNU0014]|uniref:pentapeptide repeat-containing protein n=1 Tax=Altericista sp. CCNU0014 TaxID=3082949 RepID=UPI00384EF974